MSPTGSPIATVLRLALRGLLHYRAHHILTAGAVALMAIVITGGVMVGDSVRVSLDGIAQARLGRIEGACTPAGRWFRKELAREVESRTARLTAAVVQSVGSLSAQGLQVGNIQVVGIDDDFAAMWDSSGEPVSLSTGEVALSATAAHRLSVGVGDDVGSALCTTGRSA